MHIFNDFHERYSPKSFQDIVFANQEKKQLIQDLISGAMAFPLHQGKCGVLLYGIPGTGKSALAALLPDAMEMARTGNQDSSAMRYVRVQPGANGMKMLESINNQAILVPFASQHYFVLDEVDNLNAQAMQVLKSVMNTPNCVFILTTNNFKGIEKGVASRCHCISFNAAPAVNWIPLAERILVEAGISGISSKAIQDVIEPCNGDAREILTSIQQLTLSIIRQKTVVRT